MNTGGIQVRRYMRDNIEDSRDPQTGEVNATKLAEDATWHFELHETPDEYWDWAAEIAIGDDRKRAGLMPLCLDGLINGRSSEEL